MYTLRWYVPVHLSEVVYIILRGCVVGRVDDEKKCPEV